MGISALLKLYVILFYSGFSTGVANEICRVVVVDSSSASPQLPGVTYYGVEATHSGICKFESVNAPGYRIVATAIRDWVVEAPPVIQVRWKVELDDRDARARLEDSERRIRHIVRFPPAYELNSFRLTRKPGHPYHFESVTDNR